MKTVRYGWIRDLPDHRDLHYSAALATGGPLPESVDLRPQCPPVYDQGELGSCTANAISGILEFDEIKAHQVSPWTPSRLFIYYNERALEGNAGSDSGAQLRDGIKVVVKQGVCPESEWPYDISRFAVTPPRRVYQHALMDRISSYLRLRQSLVQLRACLASGFPFVFGFTVFASMEAPDVSRTGRVPLPQPDESPVGGHAVAVVGYDDRIQAFVFRNSWGVGWGQGGYGRLPYAYVVDPGLAADFWTIRSAPGGQPLRHGHERSAVEPSPSERVEDQQGPEGRGERSAAQNAAAKEAPSSAASEAAQKPTPPPVELSGGGPLTFFSTPLSAVRGVVPPERSPGSGPSPAGRARRSRQRVGIVMESKGFTGYGVGEVASIADRDGSKPNAGGSIPGRARRVLPARSHRPGRCPHGRRVPAHA